MHHHHDAKIDEDIKIVQNIVHMRTNVKKITLDMRINNDFQNFKEYPVA